MISSKFNIQQDTVQHKIISTHIPVSGNTETGTSSISNQPKDSVRHRPLPVRQVIAVDKSDTISVCARNNISDVTFYDLNSFIFRIGHGTYKKFPYVFIDKARKQQAEDKTFLMKSLKEGALLTPQPLHADWIILIIVLAATLFTIVKKSMGNLTSSLAKFFLIRSSNEPGSRDIGGLFYWQSTILNLVSFIVIALFGYSAAAYYGMIPSGLKGILPWCAVLIIISIAITLRHFICMITGAASGRQEIFREYLLGIYQSYRLGALFLSVIVVMISYTTILPVNILIIAGLIILALTYLFRVIRLLIIFLNRNISIFYLILYLCALEILPVLIVAKFFTSLV
jgi:hypothetical protein